LAIITMQTMPNTSCPQRVASDARADVADPAVIAMVSRRPLEFLFRKEP
jgi:hypothetical protein